MFILHKSNKKVQEKLCTETDQALENAIAFEEGVKWRQMYGAQALDSVKTVMTSEPVYAVEKTNPSGCYRRGAANFTKDHVNFCMATNHRFKYCKIVVHVEKCCKKKFPQLQKEIRQRLKNRDNAKSIGRVNYIEESNGESEEDDEAQLVLRVDGDGGKPFHMKGTMCGNYFKAIFDTGSPISIFTKRDSQKMVGERKVVIRDMIEGELYVG